MGPIYDELAASLRARRPVAMATIIDGAAAGAKLLVRPGEAHLGALGDDSLDRVVARDTEGQLAAGVSEVRHYGPHGEAGEHEVTVFIESFAPPPRLLVFGAVDFTGALVRVAKVLGYHVTVCDAREVFATRRRFPMADEVVVDWPHRLLQRLEADPDTPSLAERDAICILTHDAKFDVPAAMAAFATSAGYIGAMGSRRTHDDRVGRLREQGATDADLARLHSPIGLDLGARTPEEVAVAIAAEIVATHTGRPVPRLRDTKGPLHGRSSN